MSNAYYHATLALRAPLLLEEDGESKRLRISIGVGKERLNLLAHQGRVAQLREAPPQGEPTLVLWPRTDQEGVLCGGTQLATWLNPGEEAHEEAFHALGELVRIDTENAMLMLKLHPNPKGQLKRSFNLPLVTSVAFLEELEKVKVKLRTGLEVWGEFKPRTGRIVVTKARPVPLPPIRETAREAPRSTAEEAKGKAKDKGTVKGKPKGKEPKKPKGPPR